MIFERLAGLETEYAVRSSIDYEPSTARVIALFLGAIGEVTKTVRGKSQWGGERLFTSNGGAFYHEHQPTAAQHGLLEGATPECRTPGQLLLYQRAQQALLMRAAAIVNSRSRSFVDDGLPPVGLLKNSRDAEGNTYGVHENFEIEFARGWRLWAYRLGLLALLPFACISYLFMWGFLLVILIFVLAAALLAAGLAVVEGFVGVDLWLPRAFDALVLDDDTPLVRFLSGLERGYTLLCFGPWLVPFLLLIRGLGFRAVQRGAVGFLVSRCVFSGTGTLDPDGTFRLSQRASAIRRIFPSIWHIEDVSLFWLSNFWKRATAPMLMNFRPLATLWSERQRLQLGISDANMCEVAEYLKLGVTMLVVDMAQAGWLEEAPRPRDAIATFHTIGADATLTATVETSRGPMTGLELQRWYCERGREFLEAADTVPLEAWEVWRRWEATVAALESDPHELLGRLDWVTKRYLLGTAGEGEDFAVLKKIDLRYHELGTGYQAELERAGICPRLTEPGDVERAIVDPPSKTPAALRGKYVTKFHGSHIPVRIDWQEVRIKQGRLRSKVIPLDQYRSK